MSPRISCAVLLATITWAARPAAAETVQIGPLKDNTLYEPFSPKSELNSNGIGMHSFAGRTALGQLHRTVLAFDVAGAIPPGATITGATLTMYMSRTNVDAPPQSPVALHRLTADWGEAGSNASAEEGGGASAEPGDATWEHTYFDTGFWANIGGDFNPQPSAVTLIADVDFYSWNSVRLALDVQDMLDNPVTNYGWVVVGDEVTKLSSKRFDTRENPIPAQRPVLVVDYTTGVVPALSHWGLAGLGALLVAAAGLTIRRRCAAPC